MRFFLKDKTAVNEDAEPYEDTEHLMARLWSVRPLYHYMIIIVDRDSEKPNIICDLKPHGEQLWLSAFDDITMQSLYNDVVPTGGDLDALMDLLTEIEKR